jgi:hypothetical protein
MAMGKTSARVMVTMGKRIHREKSGESDLQAVSEMIEYAYWLRMWARAGKRAQNYAEGDGF